MGQFILQFIENSMLSFRCLVKLCCVCIRNSQINIVNFRYKSLSSAVTPTCLQSYRKQLNSLAVQAKAICRGLNSMHADQSVADLFCE